MKQQTDSSEVKISVIMPAYNVEDYIREALDSLRAQTVSPDEIIIIDDGSTDSTADIANEQDFSCAYKVVSIKNNGQGQARNLGVSLASGDYIYFFDSDDFLDHDFIGKIKSKIVNSSYPDIVLFSGKSFLDGEYQESELPNYTRGFEGHFNSPWDFINKAAKHKALFCQPCLYVSKRELWGEGKIEFESNYLEDDAAFYPLIFSCKTFYVTDECFFHRRVRAGSTMTSKLTQKHVLGALNCLETTIDLYNKLSFRSHEDKKVIRKKVENLSLRYIVYCQRAGSAVKFRAVARSILLTKSFSHIVKVPLFALKLNKSKLVNNVTGWNKMT